MKMLGDEFDYVSDRVPQIIRKGEWFTHCCHRDLEQATEDILWDGMLNYRIYPTREEALEKEYVE